MAKVVRRSRLKQILAATERQMHRAVTAGAEEAKQVAETLVPVDEGDLKSTLNVDDDGAGHAVFSAGGESKISDKFVDYEIPQEFMPITPTIFFPNAGLFSL